MPKVLDIEESPLWLELKPPFDKRDVQLARRRQAKIWHPDLAPPGKQVEHERHLNAINEAADQLENLAERARAERSGERRGRAGGWARRREGGAARRGGGARRARGGPPRLRGGAGA